MKEHYEGNNFYFRKLEPTQSLHRFALPFLIFMVDLTFGKILNIRKDSHRSITYKAVAHFISTNAQVPFLQMSFKKCKAKLLEEACNYSNF